MTVTVEKNNLRSQSVKKGDSIHTLPKRLYTLKEAAVYLGMGLHGVRSLIWNGELPCITRNQDGNHRKQWIDLVDLDKWIAGHKETL